MYLFILLPIRAVLLVFFAYANRLVQSKHCMEKILSGDVQYADNLTYVITPEPIGR